MVGAPNYCGQLLFDHFPFALIHGPNIPGSYAILLFTESTLEVIVMAIRHEEKLKASRLEKKKKAISICI